MVPVKAVADAKQRLLPLGDGRAPLAAAFAGDVLTALLGARRVLAVIIVGGDGLPAQLLSDARVHQVADVRGLNPAAEAGLAAARGFGGAGAFVLPADLPCLRAEDVDALLGAVPLDTGSVVADADADGTTALLAPAGLDVVPAFGVGSFARHVAAGARPVTETLVRLRRDVDTVEHLEEARLLGVGAHTSAVLATLLDARP